MKRTVQKNKMISIFETQNYAQNHPMLRKFFEVIKRNFIIPHILFWMVSIVFFAVVLVYTRDFSLAAIDLKTAVSFFITILYLAVSVYINLFWLIPAFFKKRRFLLFSGLQIANILLFVLLNYFTSRFFEGDHPNFLSEAVAEIILVTIFLVITTLLKFMRDSIALQDAEIMVKEVERQKIGAELQALKSQVNPHFFFNTLNSLYSLSLDKSDMAPEMILKLSDLMRYVIYETKDNQVPVSKQLEFLQSYVYLEQVRSGTGLKVNFSVNGPHTSTPVDPLLFIAFIENAFKHGTHDASQHPYIEITFNLERPDRMRFTVENNYDSREEGRTEGIGLMNVRKRLDLLYPGKYSLDVHDRDGIYRVELALDVR
jgi:two-component system LytT family sensor kinase